MCLKCSPGENIRKNLAKLKHKVLNRLEKWVTKLITITYRLINSGPYQIR